MADKTLSVKINAQDNASAEFRKVGDSAKTMGEAIEGVAKSSESLQGLRKDLKGLSSEINDVGTTLTAAGAIGTGFFGIATNEALQFTSAMSNVNSIARLSASEMTALRGELLGMAGEFGAMPTELAEGLYEISSSGFSAAEGLNILEASVVAAGAGMTTTDVSAKAIVATLNAYKLSASEAGNVSDVLFKTVDSGVITFEQLATNMGNTLPLAASLGVTIEELGAAYADLTLSGIGASQAETQIAALMRAALGPTEALTEAVQEYGYSSAEALIQAEGLAGFLVFLDQASGGTSQGLLELVGTQEALNAALVLGRDNAEGYSATVEEMGGAVQDGAYTLEVFGIQMDNAAGSIRMAQAEAAVAAVNLGSALEPLVGFGADALDGILSAFNALPGPAQAAVTYLGAFMSVSTLAAGALLLTVPKVIELADAFNKLRAAGSITSLITTAGRVTAIGAAATAATLAFTGMISETRNMVAAAKDLDDVLYNMRLGGETDLAEQADDVREELNGIIKDFEGGIDLPGLLDPLEKAFTEENVSSSIKEGISTNIKRALEDSQVDAEAFFGWMTERMSTLDMSNRQSVRAFLTELADPNVLIQFGGAADGVAGSAGNAADGLDQMGNSAESALATIASLNTAMGDLPGRLDDLRMAGDWDVASQMEDAHAAIIGAFSPSAAEQAAIKQAYLDMYPDRPELVLESFDELTGKLALTEDQTTQLGESWDRITSGMESGLLDNVEVLEEIGRILSDPSLTPEQQVNAIDALSVSLANYRDHAKAMQEGQVEFLAQGENLLAWWENYDAALWEGAAAFDGSTAAAAAFNAEMQELEAFRGLVDFVQDLEAAGAALDSVLATYSRIDSLGQRSSSAGTIADNLIGDPGEWAAIDDLLASGRIELDQYYASIRQGTAIQESNARVQQDLNKIRADQLPLLAEEQLAYEQQITALSQLPALEQRRALAMQDSAVQSQVAALYSQAYAASVGEIPEEVATEMIVSAAEADPVIKDLLEQFGLIEEGADGEIRVNFPNADATIDSINRLTKTMLALEAYASGFRGENATLEFAIEVLGEEEALELFGMVENADGTYSTATMDVETTGGDEAERVLEGVTAADGTTATLGVNVEAGDSVETVDWVYERVVNADGTEAYMVLRADAETGELEEFGRIVESYTDEDQVTHVRVETDDGSYWTTIDLLTGDIGRTATIGVEADTSGVETELLTLADGTVVRVPVEADTTGWENYTAEQLEDMIAPEGVEIQLLTKPPHISDEEWQSVAPGTPITIPGAVGEVDTSNVEEPEPIEIPVTFWKPGGEEPETGDTTQTVTIDAVDNASPVIEDVTAAAAAIPDTETITITETGAGGVTTALQGVTSAAQAIPESEMVNVFVFGAAAAAQALNDVASAANSIPEAVSTTITTNVVTNYSTTGTPRYNPGILPGGQTGGIVGNLASFAGGGVVPFIGGEIGGELAYFAHGGVASLPVHGIYSAPSGTYISPHHTTAASGMTSGINLTVPITIQGNVIGIDNLTEEVARALAPAIAEAASNIFREQGVGWA